MVEQGRKGRLVHFSSSLLPSLSPSPLSFQMKKKSPLINLMKRVPANRFLGCDEVRLKMGPQHTHLGTRVSGQ